MENRKECTECGSLDTEQVHVEWLTNEVEEVRVCNDCPAQYDVTFGNPIKATTMMADQ